MRVPVKQVGQYGVNRDLSQHELPINVWTDALNIRFLDGLANQTYGHNEIYASPSITPYFVMPVTVAGVRYWIYAGATKIYTVAVPGGTITHTDVSRAAGGAYAATRNSWMGTVLGGLPVLNNGIDEPQYWLLNGLFLRLANWPATTYCKSMRSFKNMLVALNVTKTATLYPYMVKWSHPADPGTIPTTWDITDATKDAGELDLAEGYDAIVDGLALRDSLVIYKQQSVWRLDYIGGVFVVKAQKVLGTSGAMNKNCIVEIDGQHFVLTNMDVVIHDGQQATSVIDKQSRRYLFQNIDETYKERCFVAKNPYLNEIFVCYPEAGQTVCTKAMVWNWVDRTVTFRALPSINHMAAGALDRSSTGTWTTAVGTWADQVGNWGTPAYSPDLARVLMAPDTTKLYLLDETATFAGTAISSFMERRGLAFDAPDKTKLISRIFPRITGTDGLTVLVYVGSADDPYENPTYGDAITYTIGTTVSCDTFCTGRYMAVKFASGTASVWRLDSYDIEVKVQGTW